MTSRKVNHLDSSLKQNSFVWRHDVTATSALCGVTMGKICSPFYVFWKPEETQMFVAMLEIVTAFDRTFSAPFARHSNSNTSRSAPSPI